VGTPNWPEWLESSGKDLEASKLLFEAKIYPQALYHLQQANEKLAKALLLKTGILAPQRALKDWDVKKVLGFLQKQPVDYGHRILPSLLSDADKAIPRIEDMISMAEKGGGFRPQLRQLKKIIKDSKAGVTHLKTEPQGLLTDQKELQTGVKALNEIADRVELATEAMEKELSRLEMTKVTASAVRAVRRVGFKVRPEDIPPAGPMVRNSISGVRLSMLCTLAVTVASVLDPLESVTRYPKEKTVKFDEENPYVKEFRGWWGLVDRIRKMSV
jgi:HEPN domain-containing protein